MNIKKILKESLENYNDTWMADETKKKAYAKGFAIDCNKSFMVTKECKFILNDEKTKNIYDITDVVEIICDNIQEEIEERLS